MSIEEVYLRSFVTAGALASAVAFVVILGVVRPRGVLRNHAGAIAAAALALILVVAHQILRGPVPVAELARSALAWAAALWPPDVTRRFPVLVTGALVCGMAAGKLRRNSAARFTVVVVTTAALAWVLLEPIRRNAPGSAGRFWPVFAGVSIGAAVAWTAVENAARRDSEGMVAAWIALVFAGAGVVGIALHNVTMGLLMIIGMIPMGMLGIASTRRPGLIRGPALAATVATTVTIAAVSNLYSGSAAAPVTTPLLMLAPCALIPRQKPPGADRRGPWWNGARIRYGVSAALVGLAVAIALLRG